MSCTSGPNCLRPSTGPCQSPLSTSTHVVVLDNIFNQKTLSTRQFNLRTDFAFSYQVAWPIQVRWKEGDSFDALPSTTKSSSGSGSTDPQGEDSSRDSSGDSSGDSSRNSLSGGAIAGIVIGALVFVALATGKSGNIVDGSIQRTLNRGRRRRVC